MEGKVIGVMKTSFTDKGTGEVVSGTKFYLGYRERADGLKLDGNRTCEFWWGEDKLGPAPVLLPDDLVDIEFNRYGKVGFICALAGKPLK